MYLQLCKFTFLRASPFYGYSHSQHKTCTRPQIFVAYINWRLLRHSGAVYFALDMFKSLTSIDLAVDPKYRKPFGRFWVKHSSTDTRTHLNDPWRQCLWPLAWTDFRPRQRISFPNRELTWAYVSCEPSLINHIALTSFCNNCLKLLVVKAKA